eukprot:TRINITY_DN6322_c0_g1_i1.p1 TRINITY_DN6322_c0_g1~~TRINITY_DN6322_c0_g1_i1.p1  ORF type:complete len:247 (+),score=24.31 TRINITY_DN6322_c0_g1_i1:13-753(+)
MTMILNNNYKQHEYDKLNVPLTDSRNVLIDINDFQECGNRNSTSSSSSTHSQSSSPSQFNISHLDAVNMNMAISRISLNNPMGERDIYRITSKNFGANLVFKKGDRQHKVPLYIADPYTNHYDFHQVLDGNYETKKKIGKIVFGWTNCVLKMNGNRVAVLKPGSDFKFIMYENSSSPYPDKLVITAKPKGIVSRKWKFYRSDMPDYEMGQMYTDGASFQVELDASEKTDVFSLMLFALILVIRRSG